MVAGRVKAAIGFQRSSKSPAPESLAQTATLEPSLGSASPAGSAPSKASAFARSFGAYFPRSSAQVRPARTPQVAELLRAIEQLQERESRLRVELLEQKILRETVAIVPFLEAELAAKSSELERCKETADRLGSENARLCAELDAAALEVTSRKQRIVEMEKEIAELRKQQEAAADADDCSSSASASNEHLENSSAAPNHASLAQLGAGRPYIPPPPAPPMPPAPFKSKSYFSVSSHASPSSSSPPSPSSSTLTSPVYSCWSSDAAAAPKPRVPELSKLPPIPPPPPPRPPPPPAPIPRKSSSPSSSVSVCGTAAAPPPPPPPPPARRPFGGASPPGASGQCVRREPEVVEFYHSLMRRESRRDGGAGTEAANGGGVAAARDMIGEIENRSAHLLAIKSDVERQGDFIRFLIKEVGGAAFVHIEDVVTFVKWLDDKLSRLVDERAVLKHFEWPEQKADALREAAFGYCDLKKLEAEAASFRDDARQPCAAALKKMQALFEKLEHGVYNLARVRDAATSRYTRFQIPWEWMQQDTGIVSQIKLQSVKLAMKYLKRVSSELEAIKGGAEDEELMLQGVRFAFRVHQFAGGFDVDTMRAFQELKEKASMCRILRQKQNRHMRHHRLVART
ncbi:protein INCREASED PETAL GROWTH ANISOTROPY 1-like [Phragmites australis]|uniref:protein INCREASED PETAL GROWTH ANISOTROPY 1-like n=1 Tax=Phragmites australis TaxID=29695 RepID=UPI002D79896B|nr:protein INCREASED PETAL GROWTH ANISOTROPY 1-like [Phragmites australis]